ncbi:WXG100 family type VII secretion target [Rhodococcus sp. 15-649-2-2]|uniref:WXG100 family type VII secretion target n=1 Tax=Rhodococcus sp. 15-649-2-2 TaxID=2023140 RepID=UPI0015C5A0A8|nr:WXG100 family type VII secretion target [Rhodococcus sp. 15-649-2-2]
MGDRLEVGVAVLLDVASRTDLAIEMASDDLAVVAHDMSAGAACWPGAAGEAFSALLSAWDAADATLSTDVKDLARKLQASAREYAEAEARTEAQIRGTG